jgi:hypothetical protein
MSTSTTTPPPKWISDWTITPPRAVHKTGFWCCRRQYIVNKTNLIEESLEIAAPQPQLLIDQAIELWNSGRLG